MSRLIDIDDSRNCYIGMDGEYETWNIDPNVIAEAQPQRKTGKWIDGYKRQTCSVCKQRGYRSWNFCPNCGADMRGESDDIPNEYFESGGK